MNLLLGAPHGVQSLAAPLDSPDGMNLHEDLAEPDALLATRCPEAHHAA